MTCSVVRTTEIFSTFFASGSNFSWLFEVFVQKMCYDDCVRSAKKPTLGNWITLTNAHKMRTLPTCRYNFYHLTRFVGLSVWIGCCFNFPMNFHFIDFSRKLLSKVAIVWKNTVCYSYPIANQPSIEKKEVTLEYLYMQENFQIQDGNATLMFGNLKCRNICSQNIFIIVYTNRKKIPQFWMYS